MDRPGVRQIPEGSREQRKLEETGSEVICGAVPTGSSSRGGDVAVYVFDINPMSLPTPFYSVLVSVSVFMALSTVFHSINSPSNSSLFSLCSSGLISALLVL